MNPVVLHQSSHLKAFRNGLHHAVSDVIIVCFQYRIADQHLDQPGFAESFFASRNIEAVCVNCATNEWYQYPDLPDALTKIRAFASGRRRIVTYGTSMGGYAALRFAGAIGAHASIAVGPQYSPRSTVIAAETRYDVDVLQTSFLHEDTYRISPLVQHNVVHDPLLRVDTCHLLAYRREAPLRAISIPFGGHTPTIPLAQCGLLDDFILQLVEGTFCASRFRRMFRAARSSSSEYRRALTDRLLERERRRSVGS